MNALQAEFLVRQQNQEVGTRARRDLLVRAARAQQRAEKAGRRAEKASLAARAARERLVVAWR